MKQDEAFLVQRHIDAVVQMNKKSAIPRQEGTFQVEETAGWR
jgi:hypothetical protein